MDHASELARLDDAAFAVLLRGPQTAYPAALWHAILAERDRRVASARVEEIARRAHSVPDPIPDTSAWDAVAAAMAIATTQRDVDQAIQHVIATDPIFGPFRQDGYPLDLSVAFPVGDAALPGNELMWVHTVRVAAAANHWIGQLLNSPNLWTGSKDSYVEFRADSTGLHFVRVVEDLGSAARPPHNETFGGRERLMRGWMLSQISDYWDVRASAIWVHAERLAAVQREDRAPSLTAIRESVERHLDALSQQQLEQMAWVMVDDLYRTVANLSYWDASLTDYLSASVRPVLRYLTRRGYALRYFVDNDFELTPVGLAGPVQWFPLWFGAAGLAYVSPQEVAFRRISSAGRRADSWTDILTEYAADARSSALDALKRCRSIGSHVVYLDAESSEDAGDLAFQDLAPGVILAFRNTAPLESSTCIVTIVPRAS